MTPRQRIALNQLRFRSDALLRKPTELAGKQYARAARAAYDAGILTTHDLKKSLDRASQVTES